MLSLQRLLKCRRTLTRSGSTFIDKFDETFFGGGAPVKEQHSRKLAQKDVIYSVDIHDIKPGKMKEYLKNSKTVLPGVHESKDISGALYGQFVVKYGKVDRVYTLWSYQGYSGLEESTNAASSTPEFVDYTNKQLSLVTSRTNQLCYKFSFWPNYVDDYDGGIFEIRTYTLKPGSMMEWANVWSKNFNNTGSRGIRLREDNAVMGLFSQIGDLYQVHHIWRYRDLEHRKEERSTSWEIAGWSDCVVDTVPLIRNLEVNIMTPTDFSPLQ